MSQMITSVRLLLVTVFICCVAYPLLIMYAGKAVVPDKASGSLLRDANDNIIGSELIAQPFKRPEYLWPRPSAVDYNGAGAGGSNKSPTNPDLRKRAEGTLQAYGVAMDNPIPADLVAASGSGLDPHITLKGALYQTGRIAQARGVSEEEVKRIMQDNAFIPGYIFVKEPIVNVLKVNIELDRLEKKVLSAWLM